MFIIFYKHFFIIIIIKNAVKTVVLWNIITI